MLAFRPRVFPVSFSQSLRSASDAARLFDPIGSPLKLPRHGDEPVGGRAQGHHHVRRCGARRRRRTAGHRHRPAGERCWPRRPGPGCGARRHLGNADRQPPTANLRGPGRHPCGGPAGRPLHNLRSRRKQRAVVSGFSPRHRRGDFRWDSQTRRPHAVGIDRHHGSDRGGRGPLRRRWPQGDHLSRQRPGARGNRSRGVRSRGRPPANQSGGGLERGPRPRRELAMPRRPGSQHGRHGGGARRCG